MTQPIERDPIYRGCRFQTETIELCVRWYIIYRLSYRDLAVIGKLKTLALGVHPDVSLEKARLRHQLARTLLADGVEPSARKRVLGNRVFAMTLDMRWQGCGSCRDIDQVVSHAACATIHSRSIV